MRSEAIARQLKVLWRADRIIADIRLRVVLARAGLTAVALSVGIFGLVMLGIGAYLALSTVLGPTLAAVLIGSAAILIALALVWIASGVQPGRDLELAQELHASAVEALAAEARTLEADLGGLIRVVRNPLDGALPGLVVPVAGMVLKALKARSGKSPA